MCRIPWHPDAVDGDRDPRLGGDRRQRRADGLPQARRDEFAWRQCRGDRGGSARAADALADAVGLRSQCEAADVKETADWMPMDLEYRANLLSKTLGGENEEQFTHINLIFQPLKQHQVR